MIPRKVCLEGLMSSCRADMSNALSKTCQYELFCGVYQSRNNNTSKPQESGTVLRHESVVEEWEAKPLELMLILMFKSEAQF